MNDLINTVKLEIAKDNPDWMIISKLSQKIANEMTLSCPLGFKKGFINFIKVNYYGFEELMRLDEGLYSVKYINFVDQLPNLDKDEIKNKISILITHNKNLLLSNKFPKDIPIQIFNISKTWDKKEKRNKFNLKNNETNETIRFYDGELLSIIRDRKLNKLF